MVEDRFDLIQGLKEWWEVLTVPHTFFGKQVWREGLKAPMATLTIHWIVYCIPMLILADYLHRSDLILIAITIISIVVIGPFFGTWVVYCMMDRTALPSPFSTAFRAVVYSMTPATLLFTVSIIVGLPAFWMISGPIALVWGLTLRVLAFSNIQGISVSRAIGFALLLLFIGGLIVFSAFIYYFVVVVGPDLRSG